jgi:hypothetical protein
MIVNIQKKISQQMQGTDDFQKLNLMDEIFYWFIKS